MVGSLSENTEKLIIAESRDCPPYVIEIGARQIAEILYFLLSRVDALQGKGLRYVFEQIFGTIHYNFRSGVDFAAETFTERELRDELLIDWVKSD